MITAHELCTGVRIAGIGIAYPDNMYSNDRLIKELLRDPLGSTDEWIVSRTGIRERRISAPGIPTSHWGNIAAQRALAHANISAADIDMIITATVTPDHGFPTNSCITQEFLGAVNAGTMDVSSACASFGYALQAAHDMIMNGSAGHVLVIGSDNMASVTHWYDRGTCPLFGDAAGAFVLTGADDGDFVYGSCGSAATKESLPLIIKHAGGSAEPVIKLAQIEEGRDKIWMDGSKVFKLVIPLVVERMQAAFSDLKEKLDISQDDVSLFLFHQANLRIVDAVVKRMGIPAARVYNNIERFGNTTSASIPVLVHETWEKGLLKPGHHVMLVTFGAGFVWSITLLKWSLQR